MSLTRRALVLILLTGICLIPSMARGGANGVIGGEPVPAHKFFDGKNFCLQSLSIVAMAADAAATHQALQVPGTTEVNPLARSQGALISLKIAGAGAGLGMSYLMHRTGHHRAERVIPVIFGIPSGAAAAHNFMVRR